MPLSDMDLDTMKAIAELSAQAAAHKVAESVRKDFRDDLRTELEKMEVRIEEKFEAKFNSHFGSMSPADHIIQHDRVSRMFGVGHSAVSSLFKGLAARAMAAFAAAAASGAAIYEYIKPPH